MADSERIFDLIGRLDDKITNNHTEVVQRLTQLEANQHKPSECSEAKRLEKKIIDHMEDDKKDKDKVELRSYIKTVAHYVLTGITAAITALVTAMQSNSR